MEIPFIVPFWMMELVSDACSFFEICSPLLDLYLFLAEVIKWKKIPFHEGKCWEKKWGELLFWCFWSFWSQGKNSEKTTYLIHRGWRYLLTLRRTRKFRGVGWWNLSPEFDIMQYFETILPSVESLWCSLQDKLYLMGGGAAGGLWRHQQWSPPSPPSWILPRIRNQVKTVRINNFLRLTCKITHK